MSYNQDLINLERFLSESISENDSDSDDSSINHYFDQIENQNLILSIKDYGYLAFPCNVSQLKELVIQHASNNSNTDGGGSKVWEVSKDLIKVENKSWKSTLESMVYSGKESLDNLKECKFKIEFSKMLIYENSSSNSSNSSNSSSINSSPITSSPQQQIVDSQENETNNKNDNSNNIDNSNYNLIIFPNNNQGGKLLINDSSQSLEIDLETKDILNIQYSIFNQQYQFQILPNGFRACLVYNLIKTSKRVLSLEEQVFDLEVNHEKEKEIQIEKEIKKQLKETGKLVYVLENKYQSVSQLCDEDKLLFDKLIKIKNNINGVSNNSNGNNNGDNSNNSDNSNSSCNSSEKSNNSGDNCNNNNNNCNNNNSDNSDSDNNNNKDNSKDNSNNNSNSSGKRNKSNNSNINSGDNNNSNIYSGDNNNSNKKSNNNNRKTKLLVFLATLFPKSNGYYLCSFLDENDKQLEIKSIKVRIKKQILPQNSIGDISSDISNASAVYSAIVILDNKANGHDKPLVIATTSFEAFPSVFTRLLKKDKEEGIETDIEDNFQLLEHFYFEHPSYKPAADFQTEIKNLVTTYLPLKLARAKRLLYKNMAHDTKLLLENLDFPVKSYLCSTRIIKVFGESSIKHPELFLEKLEKIASKIPEESFVSIFQSNIDLFISNLSRFVKLVQDKKNIVALFKKKPDQFISNFIQITSKFKLKQEELLEILVFSKPIGQVLSALIKFKQQQQQEQQQPPQPQKSPQQKVQPLPTQPQAKGRRNKQKEKLQQQQQIQQQQEELIDYNIDHGFIINYIKSNQSYFLPSLKNNIKDIKEYVPQVLAFYPEFIQDYKNTIDVLIDKYSTLNIDVANPKPINTGYYKLLIVFCSVLGPAYNDQLQELKVKTQLKFTQLLCGPMEEMIRLINYKSPLVDIWNFIYSNGCQYLVQSYCQNVQMKFFMQLIQVFKPNEGSIESYDAFHKSLVSEFIFPTFTATSIPQFLKNSEFFSTSAIILFMEVVMNYYIRTKVKSYSINIRITCTHEECQTCDELNNFFKDSRKVVYRWCDSTQYSINKAKELVLFLSVHSELLEFKQIEDIPNKQMFLIEKKDSNCTKIISPYNTLTFKSNLKQLLAISRLFAPSYFDDNKVNEIQNVIN